MLSIFRKKLLNILSKFSNYFNNIQSNYLNIASLEVLILKESSVSPNL